MAERKLMMLEIAPKNAGLAVYSVRQVVAPHMIYKTSVILFTAKVWRDGTVLPWRKQYTPAVSLSSTAARDLFAIAVDALLLDPGDNKADTWAEQLDVICRGSWFPMEADIWFCTDPTVEDHDWSFTGNDALETLPWNKLNL